MQIYKMFLDLPIYNLEVQNKLSKEIYILEALNKIKMFADVMF